MEILPFFWQKENRTVEHILSRAQNLSITIFDPSGGLHADFS
jgi:hypothetical protein